MMNNSSGGPPPALPPSQVFKRGRPGEYRDRSGIPARPPFDPRFGGRGGDNGPDVGSGSGTDFGSGGGGRFGRGGRVPLPTGRGMPMTHGRERGPMRPMGRDIFPPGSGGRHHDFGRGQYHMNPGHVRADPRSDPRSGHFAPHQRPPPPPPLGRDMLGGRGRGPPPIINHLQHLGVTGGMQQHQGMQLMHHLSPMHQQHHIPHIGAPHIQQRHPPFQQGPPISQFIQNQGLKEHEAQFQNQQVHLTTLQPTPAATVQTTQPIYSKEQIDQAWTEHTAPNSMKYFHNPILHESTYSMPAVLAAKAEQASSTTTGHIQAVVSQTWIEYNDPTTGKTYYSNGISTTWEKPDGFGSSSENTRTTNPNDEDEPPTKRKKSVAKRETSFSSKSEAQSAFKGLLLAKGITPTNKWNEVMKSCSADSRWDACEILSLGERKQALAEYQTKRASELKNLDREERKRAKDAFVDLLAEVLSSITTFNAFTSRLSDMRDTLSKDDRFYAVEEEGIRESLFLEFCEEMRKREERKKRNKKRDMKEAFFSVLKDHEESAKLTFASTWSSFLSSLNEVELNDPRFLSSQFMSDSDRELYFSDFVIELQTVEDEKRRRIRDARKRAEVAQREAFCETLRCLAIDGKIIPSSRWGDVEEFLALEPTYGPVVEQDRNVPRDLFDDFIAEWDSRYQTDRSFMVRLLNMVNGNGRMLMSVTVESTYDEFKEKLLSSSAPVAKDYQTSRHIMNTEDPVSHAKVFFNEITGKAKGTLLAPTRKATRLSSTVDDTSEDEGEIIEDGEIEVLSS